jgi:hypothetical protein
LKALILTIITILFLTTVAPAASADNVSLRVGQQRTAVRGDIRVRFVSIVEDSRCPVGTNCVWAGNAKVRVRVTDRFGKTATVEMNTTMGQKGVHFGGYAINLKSLTPLPRPRGRLTPSRYTAVFSVERLSR